MHCKAFKILHKASINWKYVVIEKNRSMVLTQNTELQNMKLICLVDLGLALHLK